jgi:hypothetical protein
MIQGARRSEMPGFFAPQLAASRAKAPTSDQWLHDVKYDGYRVQLPVNKQQRIIFTRGGLDWTKRFVLEITCIDRRPLIGRHGGGTRPDDLERSRRAAIAGTFSTSVLS